MHLGVFGTIAITFGLVACGGTAPDDTGAEPSAQRDAKTTDHTVKIGDETFECVEVPANGKLLRRVNEKLGTVAVRDEKSGDVVDAQRIAYGGWAVKGTEPWSGNDKPLYWLSLNSSAPGSDDTWDGLWASPTLEGDGFVVTADSPAETWLKSPNLKSTDPGYKGVDPLPYGDSAIGAVNECWKFGDPKKPRL